MNMRFLFPLMIVLLIFSTGCRRTSNVIAPSGGTGMLATQGSFTAKDMREAIFKGCIDSGWNAFDVDEKTIEAKIIVRNKHTVVVSIPYTATAYTINYKSSVNMKYSLRGDGTFSISRSYNNWVNNLDQAIQRNISLKKM